MSVESPQKRRQGNRERQDERVRESERRMRQGVIGRTYRWVAAPFRLANGAGRLRALTLGSLIAFSLLAARLVDLQAVQADGLAKEARGNRTVNIALPADRGTIYDSASNVLVQSVPARDVTVDPWNVPQGAEAEYAAKLAPLLNVSPQKIVDALARRTNSTGNEIRFSYLARQIKLETWDQITRLRLSTLNYDGLPAVFSTPASLRSYPSGSLAANVLGYVDYRGKGVAGLEGALNSELSGTDGRRTYEASAGGAKIPTGTGSEVVPKPGISFHLSINSDLQWIAQEAINNSLKQFKADNVVVVAMEPSTGRIIVSAQAPTSDPNDQAKRSGDSLRNLAVEQAFEPGSTAKVMTMAGAINEGKVDINSHFPVPNELKRGGFAFHDDVSHPYYNMYLPGILAQSSNIGTIQVAETIGPVKQYEYLKRFGVGVPSGLNYPLENPGYVPHVDQWSSTSFPTIAFGQGLSVNAIQAASVFATIANGGVKVTPRLIDSKTYPDGTVVNAAAPTATKVIESSTAQTLRDMMEEVVTMKGTAPQAAIPGYRVAGKTGTAQRFDEKSRTYKGYVASFIGMAPSDDPKLVVAVITTNPRGEHFGSTTGGPIFKRVMSAALDMMNVPPSGTEPMTFKQFAPGSVKGGPWNWR